MGWLRPSHLKFTNMKKIITLLLLLPLSVLGQFKTGVVRYGEIQSMGMGAPVGADYNAILVFNTDTSLYITRQDSLEGEHVFRMDTYTNGENTFMQTYATNEIGFRFYNDRKNNTMYARDIGFDLVKQKTPKIDWTIHDKTKTIGDFKTQKATASYKGRDYTAWFTTDIALPYGPWKLQGLPGIILEAYDTNKEIYWYFKSLKYPGNFSNLLKPIPNKDERWMTYAEFKAERIKGFKKTQVGSRMVSENAGIKTKSNENNSMLKSYIEDFEIKENKK